MAGTELRDALELCCGKRSCPTVALRGENVVIVPDEGPELVLSRAQAALMREWLESQGI
jgi:hypothetical protein